MTDDRRRNIADELAAIKAVADALQPLDEAAQRHVIAYVSDALGITGTAPAIHNPMPGHDPVAETVVVEGGAEAATDVGIRPTDIRSLKEQKQPRSANEMAALVAYYVSELLPSDERRTVVTSNDIEKYFKQASYRLPSRVAQTLPDAARAGYFDVVGRGQYKLNPVGYNLVAHAMPSTAGEGKAARQTRKAATGRRGTKKATPKKVPSKRNVSTGRSKSPTKAAAKRPAPKRS